MMVIQVNARILHERRAEMHAVTCTYIPCFIFFTDLLLSQSQILLPFTESTYRHLLGPVPWLQLINVMFAAVLFAGHKFSHQKARLRLSAWAGCGLTESTRVVLLRGVIHHPSGGCALVKQAHPKAVEDARNSGWRLDDSDVARASSAPPETGCAPAGLAGARWRSPLPRPLPLTSSQQPWRVAPDRHAQVKSFIRPTRLTWNIPTNTKRRFVVPQIRLADRKSINIDLWQKKKTF